MSDSEVKISFDEKQLRVLVAEHLFGKLTEESKISILAKAFEHLLERSGHRDSGPTRLQEVFNKAVSEILKNMAVEWLQEPDMQAKIAELLHEAADQVFTKNREGVVKEMAEALSSKLGSSRVW
jgi:hypothetical protein